MTDFDQDFLDFASLSGLGANATFDGATSVWGVFDNARAGGLNFGDTRPVFLCTSASTPAALGKTLAIDGVTYVVREADPDGTGMVRLRLERQ